MNILLLIINIIIVIIIGLYIYIVYISCSFCLCVHSTPRSIVFFAEFFTERPTIFQSAIVLFVNFSALPSRSRLALVSRSSTSRHFSLRRKKINVSLSARFIPLSIIPPPSPFVLSWLARAIGRRRWIVIGHE